MAYRKAIEIDPRFHQAWFFLATLLHERLRRYSDAELAYGEAIKSDPQHTCPREQLVKLVLSDLQQPARALELAEQSLEASPNNARLLRNLAWHLVRFSCQYISQADWAQHSIDRLHSCRRHDIPLQAVRKSKCRYRGPSRATRVEKRSCTRTTGRRSQIAEVAKDVLQRFKDLS